jgi:AP-4 complex subunit mu-1
VVSASSATTRDEIFVDIIEKVNVTFNANGDVVTSEINGHIQVRNFLQGEDTKVKLALSEDLTIGGKGASAGGAYTGVILDDCNFHETANLDQFDIDRTISLRPPQGEFSLMHYRSADDFKPPFRIVPIIDESVPYKVGIELKLYADFNAKHTCTGCIVTLPIPKGAIGATARLPKHVTASTQHVMYDAAEKQIVWQFKKLPGGSDHECSVQISLQSERIPNVRREIGPLSLTFQIPTFSASDLAVRYLQVIGSSNEPRHRDDPPRNPHRWIRYMTKSSSYVVRI